MPPSLAPWLNLQTLTTYRPYLVAILVFAGGWLFARAVKRVLRALSARHLSPQHGMLASRGVYYLLVLTSAVVALDVAGVNISVLLGAAGVLTIALGFAAQTSTSNLISGLFLMAERPFVIGDTIETGTAFGEVVSIDLLSVKIRTFDNILLRLPNEALLKAEIANWTRLPIRRLDFDMTFPFDVDPARVKELLEKAAEADELCLDEPKPFLFFRGFGESGFQVRFGVWSDTSHYIQVKNRFFVEILSALRAEGIRFAHPRRDLGALEPLPVHLAGEAGEQGLVGG